ncbi:MAG: hypothetical protein V1737_00420 [Chloroflexota bacterium]
MGEIKSAFEIAQEKAAGLGEASTDERRKWRKEKRAQIGEALAQKHLWHYDLEQLRQGLDQYKGDERQAVMAACAASLLSTVDLDGVAAAQKIMDTLRSLISSQEAQRLLGELATILGEYASAVGERGQETDRAARALLHQLRISGTAIAGANPKAKLEWQQRVEGETGIYRQKLDGMKRQLIDLLSAASA